ncbi:MAG: hypothetical protein QXQ73_04330 [Desulfurococcaceae archaeon]
MVVVGLEYPVLVTIASVAFLVVISASLFLYLHVISELRKVPVLNGGVEVYSVAYNSTQWMRLVITVSNERGEPVELVQMRIYAEGETLVVNSSSTAVINSRGEVVQSATIYGLVNGKVLLSGATAHVIVDIPRAYFTTGKTYQALLLFDKGTLVLSFDVK